MSATAIFHLQLQPILRTCRVVEGVKNATLSVIKLLLHPIVHTVYTHISVLQILLKNMKAAWWLG